MQFGLFSNNRRPGVSMGEGWSRDIAEIVAADRAGFREAWLSEHESPAELMIAKAAALTRSIRLGPAVRPLGYYHPLQVALEANACDQLCDGRYMLGVGTGFNPRKLEWRGRDASRARDMTAASIDLILRLFHATEPFDHEDEFWSGKQMVLSVPPVQQPHPPMAVSVLNSEATAEMAGRNGFMVLTPDFMSVAKLRAFGDAMERGQAAAGRPPGRGKLRGCRVVYVAESDQQARDEMRESYTELLAFETVAFPHHHKDRVPPGGTLADITFDYLVDSGNLLIGSPRTVQQGIERFHTEAGGFGLLMLHAGRDYATPDGVARSIHLLMERVAPTLRHIGDV
jgi:alkanesulfonate monooxygenase SsuD/methylene tetrahydromethanopterin reductase-like flavin-dependent oxidoreductase (luciferase family)